MESTFEALAIAVRHHQAGALANAEAIYRQILAAEPNHVEALHLLGVIAHQIGRNDMALQLIGRALALKPDHADAHCHLGAALAALRRPSEAIASYERALALKPGYVEAYCNLGVVLKELGRLEELVARLEQALALTPDSAEVLNNLGNALQAAHRHEEAVARYERALAVRPDFVQAHNNLGVALKVLGKHEEFIASYRRALALNPGYAEAHHNLGSSLAVLHRNEEAIASFGRALAIAPDYSEARYQIGLALMAVSGHAQAVEHFERVLAKNPLHVEAHNSLAVALVALLRLDDAIAHCERALAINPDFAEAHNNLGNILLNLSRHQEAMACYRKALALKPGEAGVRSNLLLAMNYLADGTPKALLGAHREWAKIHAGAVKAPRRVKRSLEPGRRLRVGYLSPDFREHSVYFFLAPLLAAHDHEEVEVFCYADMARGDAFTTHLMAHADHWVSIVGKDHDAAAARIREDEIDILVDLAGHTAQNRLAIFARKAAPLQMSWLGYPNTTGLPAIDYRITDEIADPPDVDRFYTEKLIRLPRCFVCYEPSELAGPVAPLPAPSTGHVTFGSFNNLPKVTPQVVKLWARILESVPGSRLLIKAFGLTSPTARQRFLGLFRDEGIETGRIALMSWLASPRDHLALYGQVDIALDPFPYNGTATTCEALWMGVPVINLRGGRHAGRVGASLLTAARLPHLIAEDPLSYIAAAAELARDLDGLAALRAGLREQIQASPLCDANDFARAMEAAYRSAWRRRCEAAGAKRAKAVV